jgi:hypoxanthine phosphoribosyltransferase
MTDKVFYTQSQIDAYIDKLAATIKNSGYYFDWIVGIENGGLHISVPLSKLLDIKHSSIKISFYGDEITKQKTPAIDYHDVSFNYQERYLLVDDLIDTGETFKHFHDTHPQLNVMTAVLFWKRHNEFDIVPNFYATMKPDQWIVMPWESQT